MPHQCTTCGHAFDDGSKDMLGGCPACGGTKFQFYPEGAEVPDEPPTDDEAEPPEREEPAAGGALGRAAHAVHSFVDDGTAVDRGGPDTGDPDPDATWPSDDPASTPENGEDGDIIDADERDDDPSFADADEAADRDDVVAEGGFAGGVLTSDGEPAAGAGDDPGETPGAEVVAEPSGQEPDMAELREQLNDQFESIKVVEPGQYELNLMELYDREEYIIALQENGRYVIQVPENWLGDRFED